MASVTRIDAPSKVQGDGADPLSFDLSTAQRKYTFVAQNGSDLMAWLRVFDKCFATDALIIPDAPVRFYVSVRREPTGQSEFPKDARLVFKSLYLQVFPGSQESEKTEVMRIYYNEIISWSTRRYQIDGYPSLRLQVDLRGKGLGHYVFAFQSSEAQGMQELLTLYTYKIKAAIEHYAIANSVFDHDARQSSRNSVTGQRVERANSTRGPEEVAFI